MSFSRNISTRLDRRLAIFAIVAVGGLGVFSGKSAQAGVILPWVDESRAVAKFGSRSCDAMDVPVTPASDDSAPADREENTDREALEVGLLGTGGGASAPVNGASGQTNLLSAAMFEVPADVPSLACSSRRMRELSVRLPQPPRDELLDPPKNR